MLPPEAELQMQWNCDGLKRLEKNVSFEWAPSLKQCPRSAIPQAAFRWFELFTSYKVAGVLPYPGTWAEQPAKVLQAFELLEVATIEARMFLAKKTNANGG